MTLHIVLFTVLAQMLLLVSCFYPFQYLLCFVQVQGQRTIEKENKNIQPTKKLLSFLTSLFYQLWLDFELFCIVTASLK